MKERISLAKRVELAETEGNLEDISDLIINLYDKNDDESLELCVKLAMSDFGGITHKMEFQNIVALGTLHWGLKGIVQLGKATIKANSFRPINNTSNLLSHISSKTLDKFMFSKFNLESVIQLDLSNVSFKADEWTKIAKRVLIDIVKSVETEEKFPLGITNNLGFSTNENAAEHVFAALIAR